ncbi:Zinc finger and Thymidylate synthase domain containing protein [Aphelenchoides bicaudatus]|nr:Zinc finger and Thymidylate synthase domain containing protein [Aphelenchoides bicaudatus]
MKRYEVVANRSIDIPSAPKIKSKATAEIQTQPLQYNDVSLEPIEPESKSTQTEKFATKPPSAKHVRINHSVIQLILTELAKCEQESGYFQELDAFHQNQTLQIDEMRVITIEALEESPINSVICGQGRVLAILCGEKNHSSWCLHTGKVLVVDRHQRNWTHLGSCPTIATFADQEQLIVGTASGEIVLIFEGQILWSSANIHLQTVTALIWLTSKHLFSTGLDGRLNVLNLQGNSLESAQSSSISVSDLPRAMKKSNSSSLKVGIVSATNNALNINSNNSVNEVFVATETGAILSVDAGNLETKTLGYEIEGIEQLRLNKDSFFSVSANKEAKLLERGGQTIEWLGISGVNTMICRKDGLCILLTDKEIVGVRSNPSRILMREPTTLVAIDFDRRGNIVGVDLHKGAIQLHWFQLSDYS